MSNSRKSNTIKGGPLGGLQSTSSTGSQAATSSGAPSSSSHGHHKNLRQHLGMGGGAASGMPQTYGVGGAGNMPGQYSNGGMSSHMGGPGEMGAHGGLM